MTDSFVFYRSFYEPQKKLDKETRFAIFELVCEYAFNGEIIESGNPVADAFFETMKPQIDANKKRREDGKTGGRPKTKLPEKDEKEKTTGFENKKPVVSENENHSFENKKPNVNVNVNDNDNVNVNVNSKCEINPPKAETGKPSKKENHYKLFFDTEIKKDFEEPIRNWLNYKKSKKQGYPNLNSLLKMQDELIKCGNGTVSGVWEVVNSAIAKGYSGFFPVKSAPPDVSESVYNKAYIENIDWGEFDIHAQRESK